MAGKMRFAAIFVTLSSMLAAGGGAAYYFSHGGKLPFGLGTNADASVTTEAAAGTAPHGAPADLAAVETAWAEAGTTATVAGANNGAMESTPTARSADAVQTRGQRSSDRYSPPSEAQFSTAGDEPRIAANIASSPVPAVDDRYASLAGNEPQPADSLDIPEINSPPASLDAGPASIARGQEPGGEASIEAIDMEADTSPAAAALRSATSESGKEPNSLQRAREAFRDAPPATAGSRYGGPTGAPRTLDASAQQNAVSINPFAAQSSGSASVAPDMAHLEAIEPVPADSAESSQAEAGALPKASGSMNENFSAAAESPNPSVSENQAARSGYSGVSSGYGNQIGAKSLGREPNLIGGDARTFGGSTTAGEGTGRPGERALEGPQKPALVIQKIAPPEIQVGKSAKFLVKVQNVGGQTATDVVIHDEVPQGTRLVGTSPTAEVAGAQLTWNIGKLSSGEERTVEIDVQPTTEGEIGSVATVSYSAQASAKTRCTMPQLAIRMTAPEEVMIGQEQRVKIELHNPGSGDATGVMLFENVPENVRHEAGAALEFEIGTLKPGETRELELSLIAEKAGKVVNVLSARADGNLQVQQQVEFEVIAPALAVTVDGPGRRYLERAATYQVIVENPGTATARDVELVTKLPKGMQFVRANNMGEYDASSHSVYWSLAELPEGERGTVELVAMPVETGTQTLEVEGRAQQGLTDQTEQQIMIEGLASIMFEVRDAEDPIEVGGETSYEIRVANEGTKAATNVRVVVSLSPGMKVVSAEGETGHAQQGAGIVFEPLAQLAPKTDTLYRVKVKGTQPGDQRINVEVSTDDLSQPIRREESTRVFGDE